ncbi:bifunctional diaminohydroxyphosphoribosylaminopyrimidine deaminase/5-amino-6-(5-phosphoribosylamino)uracil reductase RibD [Myxococcota bacterium]|nr:bifunctional diaminohydroxyphosphoribosylaminopyrimidine deaminase/5-amino-6-(5-phosphoribosylamino)uracil reductase RibD [Myxococcota bacterium]
MTENSKRGTSKAEARTSSKKPGSKGKAKRPAAAPTDGAATKPAAADVVEAAIARTPRERSQAIEVRGAITGREVGNEREIGFMRAALDLARSAEGRTSPNPAVGAVIVKDGRIVATGFHAYAGSDHAEVSALRKLDFNAAGCELYSTLEPCDHHGRTGPCTEAILRSGIKRVVVGALDPNPIVSGRGLRRLANAGVDVKPGVLEDECKTLNEAFNFAIVHKRPFVVLKAGMSLDGRVATSTGESRWITSEEARREVHILRNRLDAILVGVGTVLADDPSLTARFEGARNPVRVILDSKLRTPPTSMVVTSTDEAKTIIATTDAAPAKKRIALEKAGVEVLVLKKDAQGRVDLPQVQRALFEHELNSVLVEGGPTVLGAFVDARLVNKVVLFVAPMLIGGVESPAAIGGQGARRLTDALSLEDVVVRGVGRDLMLTAYPRGS